MKRTKEMDSEISKGWIPVCATEILRYDNDHYINKVIQDALCFGFIFKAKNDVIYQKERAK